jgi:hypothetical protein
MYYMFKFCGLQYQYIYYDRLLFYVNVISNNIDLASISFDFFGVGKTNKIDKIVTFEYFNDLDVKRQKQLIIFGLVCGVSISILITLAVFGFFTPR